MTEPEPVRIALLNDYEVVVAGLVRMLEPYADRVRVVEAVAGGSGDQAVDVALYDTFAQSLSGGFETLVSARGSASRLIVYSWREDAVARVAVDAGAADGFVSKRAGAADLVSAVERVHQGESLPLPDPAGVDRDEDQGDWPGSEEGLTAREAEIIALIVKGLSNVEVAERAYLSVNTIKSYIRSAYRKMGVRSRSQAVLWGIDHGFRADRDVVRAAQD